MHCEVSVLKPFLKERIFEVLFVTRSETISEENLSSGESAVSPYVREVLKRIRRVCPVRV